MINGKNMPSDHSRRRTGDTSDHLFSLIGHMETK